MALGSAMVFPGAGAPGRLADGAPVSGTVAVFSGTVGAPSEPPGVLSLMVGAGAGRTGSGISAPW